MIVSGIEVLDWIGIQLLRICFTTFVLSSDMSVACVGINVLAVSCCALLFRPKKCSVCKCLPLRIS
jgi:hypothetical protein